MDLKQTLKKVKLNESTISMLLGALVIIVVGVAAINFIGNDERGDTIPAIGTEDSQEDLNTELPTEHTIQEGEDLWNISEQYYNNGYNWIAIAEANNINNPDQIEEGDVITIPALEESQPTPTSDELADSDETISPTLEPTDTPTPEPTTSDEIQDEETSDQDQDIEIEGETYTVVEGDSLWSIAERAYGDPYRWVDIASANELVNPNLIHPGNNFTIPR